MSAIFPLSLAVLAVISLTASAQEVAYTYGESGGRLLDRGNLSLYNGTDVVTSSIASATPGSNSLPSGSRKLDEIKREIKLKMNAGNSSIRDEGLRLILQYPGDGTISQICSIYDYMVSNWSYARDPLGIDIFQYSNKSLDLGKGKFSGQGDCDDFAILLASLIESIGGTPRIIFAYGPSSGHAYTEVFLGNYSGEDSNVGCMLRWLRSSYKAKEINMHVDPKLGEVWLNLDWWNEPGGAKHPGGPFFFAVKQSQVYPDENDAKSCLTPVNEPPKAYFSISPKNPDAGRNITFNASMSKDACGTIDSYLWEFGDGFNSDGIITSHAYSNGGAFKANLTIIDNDGTSASSSTVFLVNEPPIAKISFDPSVPEIHENITFDASRSRDDDGHIEGYKWEFGDGMNSSSRRQVHQYDKMGNYTVNLTVFDDKGTSNTTAEYIRANEPPHVEMSVTPAYPNAGDEIFFNASKSSDHDGMIVGYEWDFGDGHREIGSNVSAHRYKNGGNYLIKLVIIDNNNASNESISSIRVSISPDDSTKWLLNGDELFRRGQYDEAVQAYSKSYALDNYRAEALFGKGRVFLAKGSYHDAIHFLTAAIELNPQYRLSNSEYADMWIYRATALRKLGRNDEADAAVDKAEDLDPSLHPDDEVFAES